MVDKTRKQQIRQWLMNLDPEKQSNRDAVRRGLLFLFQRQTSTEQAWETTNEDNNRGFNHSDAKRLTSMAKWTVAHGFLTPKQTALVARRLVKYSGQLAQMPPH